ncbi:translation initiation factor IF-2-like [Gadus chalcogrammus]|uniref:translation initiation factor IF-2-like n=1 Tax=Gadus chalcogrammus TaxID=1042646 RepID=UPI0024C24BD6|nr:translation initiation factor IF-2-like [Gadus chalcogrammus]
MNHEHIDLSDSHCLRQQTRALRKGPVPGHVGTQRTRTAPDRWPRSAPDQRPVTAPDRGQAAPDRGHQTAPDRRSRPPPDPESRPPRTESRLPGPRPDPASGGGEPLGALQALNTFTGQKPRTEARPPGRGQKHGRGQTVTDRGRRPEQGQDRRTRGQTAPDRGPGRPGPRTDPDEPAGIRLEEKPWADFRHLNPFTGQKPRTTARPPIGPRPDRFGRGKTATDEGQTSPWTRPDQPRTKLPPGTEARPARTEARPPRDRGQGGPPGTEAQTAPDRVQGQPRGPSQTATDRVQTPRTEARTSRPKARPPDEPGEFAAVFRA